MTMAHYIYYSVAAANKHVSEGNYAQAIQHFNKALHLQPKDVQLYADRGEAFFNLCDFQSAILNYKKACVLCPENFDYYKRLAFFYYFQGQSLFDLKLYPEALEAFSRAAEMRPDVVGYHTRRLVTEIHVQVLKPFQHQVQFCMHLQM